MKLLKFCKTLLMNFNVQLLRYPSVDISNRMKLLKAHKINRILDIGANRGNYGLELRKHGYTGKIFSFESLSNLYELLEKKCKNNDMWTAYNFAIGDSDTKMEINIAGNTDSSSLLGMLPIHEISTPQSRYIGKEKIEARRLDTVYNNLCNESDKVYLKIDTQGFEKNVLDRA